MSIKPNSSWRELNLKHQSELTFTAWAALQTLSVLMFYITSLNTGLKIWTGTVKEPTGEASEETLFVVSRVILRHNAAEHRFPVIIGGNR